MENTTTLPYLVELTDEMRTKVCIIEDLVKLARLDGFDPPNWNEFVNMYDKHLWELDQYQRNCITSRQLAQLAKEINHH